jgi:N-acetylglucosaminyl-diphospho-decaprenol L-rhamnosyltransferase
VALQNRAPDARISIVMITRNRRAETLASVRRLVALPERPRVIVVDNGSSDGTVASLRALASSHVEVIPKYKNLGAAGRNVGVDFAHTPYIAFSDDDSWWAPGALRQAADLFDAHHRLALIAARILVGPEERLDPTCESMATSLADGAQGVGVPVVGFLACAAIVRRQAFREAGGFELRFGIGGEETVLALDLLRAGWQLRYVDDIVAHHHPSAARDPVSRRRREVRNALWSAWLRRPTSTALSATWDTFRTALRDTDTRHAFIEALQGVPWALKNRRPVSPAIERQLRRAG